MVNFSCHVSLLRRGERMLCSRVDATAGRAGSIAEITEMKIVSSPKAQEIVWLTGNA